MIFDPFLGAGTTAIEAMAHGRDSVGIDINSLAFFLAKVKSTILTRNDITAIKDWITEEQSILKLNRDIPTDNWWRDNGYQKNLPWRVRKITEIILHDIGRLPTEEQQDFIRCATLKTVQWALSRKKEPPSIAKIRKYFISTNTFAT